MKIKKNGKIINLTESEIKKMIKWLDNKKQTLNEQDVKTIWKTIPSDTTITVSKNILLVKAEKGKITANYKVTHDQIGDMDVEKVDFDKDKGYLELTLTIPYGKGGFVGNKINSEDNKEKMKVKGIYAQYIKSDSTLKSDKLFLKVNLNKNEKALNGIKNATDGVSQISLGQGFTLEKS